MNPQLDLLPSTDEDLQLARDYHLVKVAAYIKDETKAMQKTKNAERVAKHRQKVKEAGLVPVAIPAEIADAIKTDGIDAWANKRATLSDEDKRLIALGRSVELLRGWRHSLVMWIISTSR